MGTKISKNYLTEEDLDMLNKLSQKPKDEITFWFDHFIKECPTGKLDQKKFVEYYKLFRKKENVEDIALRCFSAFDADKNGFVDFGEFLIAYAATSGADNREKLKYVFDVYDVDNNKVIDEQEIRHVLKSMFTLLGVDEKTTDFERCIQNIMNSLDENRDTKISKGEFIDGILADSLLYTLLSPFS